MNQNGNSSRDPYLETRIVEQVVHLDDLGINLKPARAMGMTTIKVVDPDAALQDLARVLAIPLGTRA